MTDPCDAGGVTPYQDAYPAPDESPSSARPRLSSTLNARAALSAAEEEI